MRSDTANLVDEEKEPLADDESAEVLAALREGWKQLRGGDRESAERHFLAAVEAAPDYDIAVISLLEALKAKSVFYRALLRLGIKSVTEDGPSKQLSPFLTLSILGAVVAGCKKVAAVKPELGWLWWSIAGLVFAVFWLIQFADYDATIRAWFSPHRALVITGWDALCAAIGAAMIILSLLGIALFALTLHPAAFCAGFLFFVVSAAVDVAASALPGIPRTVMLSYTCFLICLPVAAIVMAFEGGEGEGIKGQMPGSVGWVILALFGGVLLAGPLNRLVGHIGPFESIDDVE